jgi:hypothetical protein
MKPRIVSKASAAGVGCLACCLIMLTGSSWAATAPIYKCLDRNLGIVYTDLPCKNGEQLDIRAGTADARAVARLEHERDALDQSASERAADERRAVADNEPALRSGYEPEDDAPAYDGGSALTANYGMIPFPPRRHHPMRLRNAKLQVQLDVAPRPLYRVPRP